MASGAKPSKRGLGRGLDALLGGSSQQTTALLRLGLEQVMPNSLQPRRVFDEKALVELAESIKQHGLLQPINVRKVAPDRYEIISGERRWRAAKLAGLTHIDAQPRSFTERESYAAALVENIQREDLSPVEEARAMSRLIEEFELKHDEMARVLGRSRAAITNTLRLLKLAPEVLDMLGSGRIEMGHARALLGVATARQHQLATKIYKNQLSVRQTEQLVAARKAAPRKSTAKANDPDTTRLAMDLSDKLGSEVQIRPAVKGRGGKLTISYKDNDQLDGIIKRLRRRAPRPPPEGAH